MKTLDYLHLEAGAAGKVVVSLQQLLADFQVHYMNLRGFHWNIKGHGFFVLHTKFEELYDDAAEKVDQIAERILQLGGVPSNKFSEYLKVAKIAEVEAQLGDEGRILVRPSGTEPLVRVMAEARSDELCHDYVYQIIDFIRDNQL